MTPELKEQLTKRVKSFLWRTGAFTVVAGFGLLIDTLTIYQVDPAIITVLGLVAGEVTKYVNTYAAQ